VAKRLDRSSVQKVDPAVDRARNGPVLEQKQIFDSVGMGVPPAKLHEKPPFVGQAILPADSLSAGPAAWKAAWVFAPARGSSTQNLLHICRSVTCSNLLVEPPERAKRRPGGNGPNQLQRLLIHFRLTKMAR
jgi:hypothetical protein